jgi:hypothetical protein
MENQLHDFAPPIPASGLFWTIPVSPDSVQVDLDRASASLRVSDLPIPDWGDLRYATTDGPNVPSVVSFVVRWDGALDRASRRHEEQRWMGDNVQTQATIDWSAQQAGFQFASDPATTSHSQATVMGRRRNGVFFAASAPQAQPARPPVQLPSTSR